MPLRVEVKRIVAEVVLGRLSTSLRLTLSIITPRLGLIVCEFLVEVRRGQL